MHQQRQKIYKLSNRIAVSLKSIVLTEDSVDRVHGDLILRSITDQPLRIGESNIRRRGSVTLIIGYDFDSIVLPNADARVSRPEVDPDRRAFTFSSHLSPEPNRK